MYLLSLYVCVLHYWWKKCSQKFLIFYLPNRCKAEPWKSHTCIWSPSAWQLSHLGKTSYALWIKWSHLQKTACFDFYTLRTLSSQTPAKQKWAVVSLLICCKHTTPPAKSIKFSNDSFSSTNEWLEADVSAVIVYTFHFYLIRQLLYQGGGKWSYFMLFVLFVDGHEDLYKIFSKASCIDKGIFLMKWIFMHISRKCIRYRDGFLCKN